MPHRLRINATNAADFRGALDVLRADLERLAKMTKSYPVICMIAGQRWVFESEQDIRDLLDEIAEALGRFDQDQAA
jgi:hypothetical protein